MNIRRFIPNALTILRYACVPFFLASWYLPLPYGYWLPLGFFLIAGGSDFLDGFLARMWKVESPLGRLLDPNADKLIVAAALIMLTVHHHAHPVAVVLILSRELFISGLREFMAERSITLHVSQLAKWKTTIQMIAIIVLLTAYGCGCEGTLLVGDIMLWAATALTLITGWQYTRTAWPHIK